jgi:Saccharopine dehydrogenase NADP binding domain
VWNTSFAIPRMRSLLVSRVYLAILSQLTKLVPTGCRTLSTAQSLISGLPRTKAICIDVSSVEDLDPQVAAHNLVISLVPYVYHAGVIKSAIKSKTNVVTTSYVSPAIKELDSAAKEAGIVVLNEVGVDPGVDHLYAIKKIDEIHGKGGKVWNSFQLKSLGSNKINSIRSGNSTLIAVAYQHPNAQTTHSNSSSPGLLAVLSFPSEIRLFSSGMVRWSKSQPKT